MTTALASLVTQVMTALQILIPVVVGLFIVTKALGERVEIKLLIGEGILAAVGLELLFTFVKAVA
jgi:ABC-type molybdate transport system permease subunit